MESLVERTRRFRCNAWDVGQLREPVMIWSLAWYGPLTQKFGVWRYEFNGVSHIERARWTERVAVFGFPKSIARRIIEFGRPPVTPLVRGPPPNTCPGLLYQSLDESWSVLFQLLPADLVLHVTKFHDWPNKWRDDIRELERKRIEPFKQMQRAIQMTLTGDVLRALTMDEWLELYTYT